MPLPSPLWSIPAITFGLGVWQVNRLFWKLDLIRDSRMHALQPPLNLTSNSLLSSTTTTSAPTLEPHDKAENMPVIPEFTRVLLKGVFDHEKECIVGPRPLADGGNAGTRDPGFRNSGYLVLTPLILSSASSSESSLSKRSSAAKKRVLVNRGWLPSFSNSSSGVSSSRVDQMSDQVEIEAVVRNGETGSIFMDPNQADRGKWVWIDLPNMAAWTDSIPSFLVEVVKDSPVNKDLVDKPAFPILRIPSASFRNHHAEYAFTWFSLCLCSAYLCWKRGGSASRSHGLGGGCRVRLMPRFGK